MVAAAAVVVVVVVGRGARGEVVSRRRLCFPPKYLKRLDSKDHCVMAGVGGTLMCAWEPQQASVSSVAPTIGKLS